MATVGTGAFTSDDSDLVVGDTNRARDVFVRDRLAQTTVRVSVGSHGEQAIGDGISGWSWRLEQRGWRYVLFDSWASNFVPGDGNGYSTCSCMIGW